MFLSRARLDGPIVAVATPRGPARRAVVRVSGAGAVEIAATVFDGPMVQAPASARVDGAIALEGVRVPAHALVFRAPRSFTGEDLVELHVPGAAALLERLLVAITSAGARPAGPGELTRRAFENGKLDLPSAEAVLSITQASSEDAARAALRQLRGGLARAVHALREALLDALAEIEAAIDFAHEDLEHDTAAHVALETRLLQTSADVSSLLARETGRPSDRARPAALLFGPPNAGKSSLLNALSRADLALVSPTAGTTRDAVLAEVEVAAGVRVDVIDVAGVAGDADTAGLSGAIDAEASRRAHALLPACDAVVVTIDGSRPAQKEDLRALERSRGRRRVVALTKSDLERRLEIESLGLSADDVVLAVSSRTGSGLDDLRRAIAEKLDAAPVSEAVAPPNERHRACLDAARTALEAARSALATRPPEIVALELRAACDALGEVTGATSADDVLDRIFARFCIGK